MANRSYLYARMPGAHRALRDLSEWNSVVPAIHLLLVGIDPRPCASRIWNADEIALEGDAGPALALVRRFLDWLEPQLVVPAGFAGEKAAALTCLEKVGSTTAYHLELGEILELESLELDGMPAQVRQLAAVATALTREVTRLLDTPGSALADSTNAYLVQVRADWQAHLGLFFPGVLYHHFYPPGTEHDASKPPATSAPVAQNRAVLACHVARLNPSEQERTFVLRKDGLEVAEAVGVEATVLAFADVAAVRLSRTRGNGHLRRHLCTLHTRTGQEFAFSNQHCAGPGAFEERTASYDYLVRALLKQVAARVPDCRFEQHTGWLRWGLLFAVAAGVFVLSTWAGRVDDGGYHANGTLVWCGQLLGAFLCLVLFANRPGRFDPLRPRLLP